ncbi:MAG: sigma-70 family RNA polymerase sigma factor [Gemmatimonadaceae bacterium]
MTESRRTDGEFETEALRHLPEVARFARSLAGNDADADDLVQDTFLTAYRQWHQYERGTACRAWLFTICRNRYYRVRERAQRQVATDDPVLESLAAAELHRSAQEGGLSDAFERSEVREAVQRAMAALPEVYREVAVLVDLHDQTYETVATILQVPVGTVRSRLFRARRLLQGSLLAFAVDAGLRPRGATPSTRGLAS